MVLSKMIKLAVAMSSRGTAMASFAAAEEHLRMASMEDADTSATTMGDASSSASNGNMPPMGHDGSMNNMEHNGMMSGAAGAMDPNGQHSHHDSNMQHHGIDPMLAGCGPALHLNASYHYGLINEEMHAGMAIEFTGNPEYDFLAGMIPHHTAAWRMCEVYNHDVATSSTAKVNPGIESLCYNITYGPVDYGVDQYDFSQPGETEQMKDVLRSLGMLEQYEDNACKELSDQERDMFAAMSGHGDMFMGCGELDHDMTRDYIAANMKMHGYMALNFTGNPHVDFLLGMIPHHEGAIDMCNIYYNYWACAPSTGVCWNFNPLKGLESTISGIEAVTIMGAMQHICTGHILYTQPKEVEWMKKELEKIAPGALADYEAMQSAGTYPCPAMMMMDHGGMDHGEMDHGGDMMDHGGMQMNEDDGGATMDHGSMGDMDATDTDMDGIPKAEMIEHASNGGRKLRLGR
mmetsp:Transcript_11816/g.24374  ORF Transcript_11816/g.24374 Transcript_11816/m.24374 type:complete len:461 (+) Transcript_11816:645-2027(+)